MCTYVCVCACMCACIHAYAHTWIACTCVYCSASSGCLLDPPNLALPLPTTPPTVLILPNLSAYSTHVEGLQFLNLALHLFDLQTFVLEKSIPQFSPSLTTGILNPFIWRQTE